MKLGIGTAGIFARSAAASHDEHLCRAKCAFRDRAIFRVGEDTWLEAIVRYPVAPREAGRVKTRLIKKLLAALNAAPGKVMFPAGANR